jgi:hypothetical protein
MIPSRAFLVRFASAIAIASFVAGVGACGLGPKQDDPLNGGEDTGPGGDAGIGLDGFAFDSSVSDTGKGNTDSVGALDDCDGGDAYPDGGCVPVPGGDGGDGGGDADAPTDAPRDTPIDAPTDAPPSDAVDDGDAADVVVGG